MFDLIRRHYAAASVAVAVLILFQLAMDVRAGLRGLPPGSWRSVANGVEAFTFLLIVLLHYGRPNHRPAPREFLRRSRAVMAGLILAVFLVAFWESLALQAAYGPRHLSVRLLPNLLLVVALVFLAVDWARGRPEARLD